MKLKTELSFFVGMILIMAVNIVQAGQRWQEISGIQDRKTHAVGLTWHLDKYPDAPTLKPHAKVVLLDQSGPGVVTLFHVSDYKTLACEKTDAAAKLILRVWYDGQENPSIEMPLMDFLGDIQSATQSYYTIYFSHVHASHNFRLPMPFRKHIKIEVENPTSSNFLGYMDVQWDEVKKIPDSSGYLKVTYQSGEFKFPHEDLVLMDVKSPGTIVAHWLQLEGDHPSCAAGQGICEGNHEIHLDGDVEPTYESLGAEDFYGHSWGFGDLESDFYTAIIRYDKTPKGGTRVAMVRGRDTDKITFRKSCKILFTYKHDIGRPAYTPATGKGKAPALQPFVDGASIAVPYRSCIYYYAKEEQS